MRFRVVDQVFLVLVTSSGIDRHLPGRRIIETIGADAGGNIVVINFPHAGGEPARIFKLLRQRDDIRHRIPKMRIEIVDLDLVGSQSRHDRSPRGVAQRQLVISAIKAHARGREAIDVRRLRYEITITTQTRGEVIDGDEQHIRTIRRSSAIQPTENERKENEK